MARAALERALCPQALDALFERCAQAQYTRDLLFSTTVDLLAAVVCRVRPSVHAAYQASDQEIAVSVTSVYNKLAGVEPERLLSAAEVEKRACAYYGCSQHEHLQQTDPPRKLPAKRKKVD